MKRLSPLTPLLFLAASSITPLWAAGPNLAQYPLHLKVLNAMSGQGANSSLISGPRVLDLDTIGPTDSGFHGHGQADLLLSPGAQAIDFNYASCPDRITLTAGSHPLATKWTKLGKQLEVLVPYSKPGKPANPNETRFSKCKLNILLHDYVFVPGGGSTLHPATMSLVDYQKNPSLQAVIEGVKTGKVTLPAYVQSPAPDSPVAIARRVDSWSIPVTPVPDAPFTATVVTEWTEHAVVGGSISPTGDVTFGLVPDARANTKVIPQTLGSRRTIARDSYGRTFEEQREYTPDGDKSPTAIEALDYIDPAQHLHYHCTPATRTCQTFPYNDSAAIRFNTPGSNTLTKDLGQKRIDNLEATGTLQVTTMNTAPPATQNGNFSEVVLPPPSRMMPLRSEELWSSPQLQINLLEERLGPPFGNLVVNVRDLFLSEPDPRLFTPPAGYQILPLKQPQQQAASK